MAMVTMKGASVGYPPGRSHPLRPQHRLRRVHDRLRRRHRLERGRETLARKMSEIDRARPSQTEEELRAAQRVRNTYKFDRKAPAG